MSLYGSLFAGVTGLNAQSTALGTISQNITNINTVGYKADGTQFSTLVTGSGNGSVGGVQYLSTKAIDRQGILQQTTNATDLGIAGAGFFVVNDNVNGENVLGQNMFTRAGHFAIDSAGNMVNASGFTLMGWKLDADGNFIDDANNLVTPDPTSLGDLLPVSTADVAFSSRPTSNVEMQASFPANLTVAEAFTGSVNVLDELSSSHSLQFGYTVADHVGLRGEIGDGSVGATTFQINGISTPASQGEAGLVPGTTLDLEFNHVAGNEWTVTIAPSDGTVLGDNPLTIEFDADGNIIGDDLLEINVEWDDSLGALDSIIGLDFSDVVFNAAGAPTMDDVGNVPLVNAAGPVLKLNMSTTNPDDVFVSGESTFVQFNPDGTLLSPSSLEMEIDWSQADTFSANSNITFNLGDIGTQSGLSIGGDEFVLSSTRQDGIPFSSFENVTVDADGIVSANFANGTSRSIFRIPLADFNNPNGLAARSGNAFVGTLQSGDFFLSAAGTGSVGSISPQSLEQSTVDIAREFANMIVTQRAFSSSSTVITTADEMLQELVQLKR